MFRILPSHLRKRIQVLVFLLVALLGAVLFYWQAARQDRLNRALFAAIRDDDTPKAIRLLNAGADPTSRDRGNQPPSLTQLWSELLQRFHGNHTSYVHPTPLIKMLAEGNAPDDGEQLARALLDRGASPNDRDDLGYSVLCLALIYHREDIARLLVQRGADVNAASGNGDTPLMLDYGDAEMPALLLQHGAKPNAVNSDGNTPLTFACKQGDINKASLLISHGADVGVRDRLGTSPLHLAVWRRNVPIVKLLLTAKADPNVPDRNGMTPLMAAVQNFWDKGLDDRGSAVIDLLLKYGASTTKRDRSGARALDFARGRMPAELKRRLIP